MFGYVLPRIPDLRVKELEYYRALYCGVCREEKKLARRLPATLSYDAVLLALCRIGAAGESSVFARCHCAARPISQTKYVKDSPALAYTAAVMAHLVCFKLADDRADEHRSAVRLAAAIAGKGAKKAVKKAPLPALAALMREKLGALSALEAQNEPSVYPGASLFGELLGSVFAFDPAAPLQASAAPPADASAGRPADASATPSADTSAIPSADTSATPSADASADASAAPSTDTSAGRPAGALAFLPPLTPSQSLCLFEIGYRVGRVIYILDAVADYADDRKSGAYNPLIAGGTDPKDPVFIADMTDALLLELSAAEGALDLLGLSDSGVEAIIRNILTCGLADVVRAVVEQGKKIKFTGKKEVPAP